MKATACVGWIVVAALCLGGCGIRHLNAPAKARLNVIGVAPAQYRPRTIIPPAPASLGTAVGQSTLHYARAFGFWSSTPMVLMSEAATLVPYPAILASVGLSLTGSMAGAAYGSAYSLLHPPPETDQARRMTGDLRGTVAALDCQQRLAATFLAEAASSPHQFQCSTVSVRAGSTALNRASRLPRLSPGSTAATLPPSRPHRNRRSPPITSSSRPKSIRCWS